MIFGSGGSGYWIYGQTNLSSPSETRQKQFEALEKILLAGSPPSLITHTVKQVLTEKNPALAELYEARLEEATAGKQLASFGFSPPFNIGKRSAAVTNKPGVLVATITGDPNFELNCTVAQFTPTLTSQQRSALARAEPTLEKLYSARIAEKDALNRHKQTADQLLHMAKPYSGMSGSFIVRSPGDPRYLETSALANQQFRELETLRAKSRTQLQEFQKLRNVQRKQFSEEEKKRHSKAADAAWNAIEKATARVESAKKSVIENQKK